jgi:hypothetical protein
MCSFKKLSGFRFLIIPFFLFSILICRGAFAQETDTIIPVHKSAEQLLKNIKVKTFTGEGFNFFEDKFGGHWIGFDFGFNALVNEDYTGYDLEFMDNEILLSYDFNLNIFQKSFGLQRNRNNLGIVTGLGFQMQDYRLNDTVTIGKDNNGVIQPEVFHLGEQQKSKLTIFSVMVPFLIEYQIPINNYKNRLYFSGGMYFAYRIGSYTKIKYRTDHSEKLKITGNYALNDFRYGIMFRTGYRWINLFAMYELTPLFEENLGPAMNPVTFGITLLRF